MILASHYFQISFRDESPEFRASKPADGKSLTIRSEHTIEPERKSISVFCSKNTIWPLLESLRTAEQFQVLNLKSLSQEEKLWRHTYNCNKATLLQLFREGLEELCRGAGKFHRRLPKRSTHTKKLLTKEFFPIRLKKKIASYRFLMKITGFILGKIFENRLWSWEI